MEPYCGHGMRDYLQHILEMKQGAEMPKLFRVNWFRRNVEGRSMWPGGSENVRVLAWMARRVTGRAVAKESQHGLVPGYEDLDWTGSTFTREEFDAIMSVAPALVKEAAVDDAAFLERMRDAPAVLLGISQRLADSCGDS
jgi:phosphoenolpyruvate carboxykinase (GTP)